MNNIILSIVVPTYNRAQLLKMLLASIVQDIDQWPNDFELIVSDNSSTDDTSVVVGELIQSGFPIKYVVNATNIGADGNFAAGFNLASGKYLWIVGDDELMYRGTFKYVLECCRRNEFGILHLTSDWFSNGQQQVVSLRSKPDKININKVDSRNLFRLANIYLTFISANVINRQLILTKYPEFNFKDEFNTNLPQLAWTYSALKAADSHYYVRAPMIGALGGNTSGYKLIEVFGVNLIKITRKYLQDVIPNAERIMTNAVVTRLLPGEIMNQYGIAERKNQFVGENLKEAAENCFSGNMYFNLFLRPLFIDSKFARSGVYFFVRVFNRINKRLGYILL